MTWRWMRSALAGALVVAGVFSVPVVAQATENTPAPSDSANCSDVELPVSLLGDGPKDYKMYGRLCHPASGPSKTIQILIHGYTYDHRYWSNPGLDPAKYDYTASANQAGYTTFAVDRLGGAGKSSRPPSPLINLFSDGGSMHDVVQAARRGAIPGGPYSKVLTVGHSFGSATAWQEAAVFNDVDGIISSDLGHPLGNIQGLATSTIPALTDPRLRPLTGLDAGYVTTTPGSRGPLFYREADADPAVIKYDEETKGFGSAAELATIPGFEPASLNIKVPVLFVMGQYDGFFCQQAGKGGGDNCATDETLYQSEKPFFPQSDFETYVLPEAGHDINNHLNASEWFDRAADWATTNFPPQG